MADTLLICEDEASVRSMLTRILTAEGFVVVTAANGEEALELLEHRPVDLVLCDVNMPGIDGFEVCRRIRRRPDRQLLPIALMTGIADTAARIEGLGSGADEFVSKPFECTVLLARIRALLRVKHLTDTLERTENVILAFARAIEAKDEYTDGHLWRLAEYSRAVAIALGCDDEAARHIWFGGVLHDVGKVAVDDRILRKPGPLTTEEFAQIRRHPLIGADIVSPMRFATTVCPIVAGHHEWWDGGGYPFGLRGESIPLGARIVAVADAWDAMTTTRPYRNALSNEEAARRLRAGAGQQFDPRIVDVFVEMLHHRLLPAQAPVAAVVAA